MPVVVGPGDVVVVTAPLLAVVVVVAPALAAVVVVAPALATEVLVAAGALVEVEELALGLDGEEQPARMPAAPSAQSACPTRLHVNWCLVPSVSSRSNSGE